MMATITPKADATPQGRSLGLMAKDVMEGYLTLNPLVLKKYDERTFKDLYRQLRKLQVVIRSAGIDLSNPDLLRTRNHRLQRMHQALTVMEHHAKQNKILLA
jgi:hypothetical protein